MMIKVSSPQSGEDLWVNPDHVTKIWKRIDNVTMLRFVNGETLQIIGSPDDFVNRVHAMRPSMMLSSYGVGGAGGAGGSMDYSYNISQAAKEQARQLNHLNLMIEAFLRTQPNMYNLPSVPYVSF